MKDTQRLYINMTRVIDIKEKFPGKLLTDRFE